MLEVRYNIIDKTLTGWCGDLDQFGHLDRGQPNEAVTILDIPIPEKHCLAYLYEEVTNNLVPNPDYVEPTPPRDPLVEIDTLKAKVADHETRLRIDVGGHIR